MAIPSISDLNELKNPTSHSRQLAALEVLRNEIIGHIDKKEILIQHGILDAVGQTLSKSSASSKLKGKRPSQETNGSSNPRASLPQLSEEDDIRLQSIILLDSLVLGGTAFARSICSGPCLSSILECLDPSENPPQIVLNALRLLLELVQTEYREEDAGQLFPTLSDQRLYSVASIRTYARILSQRNASPTVQAQIPLICQFISKTVTTSQCGLLVAEDVVELLGQRLASHYIRSKQNSIHPRTYDNVLPPAPSDRSLPYVLHALSTIISGSQYRVARLLYSPIVLAVFPFCPPQSSTDPTIHQLNYFAASADLSYDMPLPWIPTVSHKQDNFSQAFPALGTTSQPSVMDFAGLEHPHQPSDKQSSCNAYESCLIPYLINHMRSTDGIGRLEAARLLITIAQQGFVGRGRDRTLALLVVPLLVGTMDDSFPLKPSEEGDDFLQSEKRQVREGAPRILASLIEKSPILQKSAIEGDIVKKVIAFLRSTFTTVESTPGKWTSEPPTSALSDVPDSRKLGDKTLPEVVLHVMKCRESGLILVGALADREDKYRQSLAQHDLVNSVTESLHPLNAASVTRMHEKGRKDKLDKNVGNPIFVMLAGLKAARAISRSVSLLRTKLGDFNLSRPVHDLVRHPCADVVVGATDVICNIVMDFSPMRDTLIEKGIISDLAELTHSQDYKVRIGSLWALKHITYQSDADVKRACWESIGTSWLIQIITGASTSNRSFPRIGAAANAAGERVDILNAVEDEPMPDSPDPIVDLVGDTENEAASTPKPSGAIADNVGVNINGHEQSVKTVAAQLAKIKETEERQLRHLSQHQQVIVQVQGIDFIRNISQGPNALSMLSTVLNEIGQERFFTIIENTLRPLDTSPDQTQPSSDSQGMPQESTPKAKEQEYPPKELLLSSIYCLVHFAAGTPHVRDLLLQQTPVLNRLLELFSHPDPSVRVGLCWLCNNIVWMDDTNDQEAAKRRAGNMQRLGFLGKMRGLTKDPSLDVNDRARATLETIKKLSDGQGR